jgi:ADP-ribosylglycohydrolase
LLLEQKDKFETYQFLKAFVTTRLRVLSVNPSEIGLFKRLLKADIYKLPENDIQSTGYVLDTLEASIWCLLTTDNYKDAVLKAVNLGHDTDTTGTVAGGLAGILYGYESIPVEWIDVLARKEDIEDLALRLQRKLVNTN